MQVGFKSKKTEKIKTKRLMVHSLTVIRLFFCHNQNTVFHISDRRGENFE